MKKLKGKGKWIALLVIAVLLLGGWAVDSVRAQGFTVEAVSVSPDPGIADGQTPVTVRLKVTQGEQPCVGHIIYGQSLNGGSFKAKRVSTDENGIAEFIYYPYLKSKITELTDVTLAFKDESNSLFISVPARLSVVLEMVEPAEDNGGDKNTNDSMFG